MSPTQHPYPDQQAAAKDCASHQPYIAPFYCLESQSFSYIVCDPCTKECALIDSVANFDFSRGKLSYQFVETIIRFIEAKELKLKWILETQIHTAHISASSYVKARLGGKIGISAAVQSLIDWLADYPEIHKRVSTPGDYFDHLFNDAEHYQLGELQCRAIATPGHSPACMAHLIEDCLFVGPTLLMPDIGVARTNLPNGNSEALYHSIKKILSLPENTRLFVGHDYNRQARELEFETTIALQQQNNIELFSPFEATEFVYRKQQKEPEIKTPKLMWHALQLNLRAGQRPDTHDADITYLQVPLR